MYWQALIFLALMIIYLLWKIEEVLSYIRSDIAKIVKSKGLL